MSCLPTQVIPHGSICFSGTLGTLSGAFLIFLNQPRPRYVVLVCPTKNSASSATSNSLYKQLEPSFSESCTRLLAHANFVEAPKRPARLHWLTPRCFMWVWVSDGIDIYIYIHIVTNSSLFGGISSKFPR